MTIQLRIHPKLIVVLGLLFIGLNIHQAFAQKSYLENTRRIIVQFEPEIFIREGIAKTGLSGFDQKALRHNVYSITRVYPFLDFMESNKTIEKNLSALRQTYYIQYEADLSPEYIARDLMQEYGVVYAEPERINEFDRFILDSEPNDASYHQQSYLQHLQLPQAWDIVRGSDQESPVIIAIVDGGAQWNHEDLLDNQWINVDEIPGNKIDDDQNGFVDDVYGANFCDQDVVNHDPDVINRQIKGVFHGTAVAGVTSAVSDNEIGIAGAAWNAQLMHIKANCMPPNNDYHYEGVMYAAMNGADIINTSWGEAYIVTAQPSRYISETLDLATDLGSLVVASAGNRASNSNDFPQYPARHHRVLSVGATERDSRRIAHFSSYGKIVDLFAPGVDILSTYFDNQYRAYSGTSYSTPLVAGIAALVKTRFPDISPDALREQLRQSGENMDQQNTPRLNGQLGRGFINALASLKSPKFPGVRIRKWSWIDRDGDFQIDSNDEVTINIQIVNYLIDAHQLTLELVPAESYPFISMASPIVSIGPLENNDSTDVEFRFKVSEDADLSQIVQFYPRIREGAFVDDIDVFTFGINLQLVETFNALAALYNSTKGDNWRNNENWNLTATPTIETLSQWEGVRYYKLSLTHLNLENNNLRGPLPKELGSLSQLDVLGLRDNHLDGNIPKELGQLKKISLVSLENNSLSGTIPPELGNMSNLWFLYLQNNSLSGVLPKQLGQLSNLRNLNLSGNKFSGEIPQEMGQLSKLNHLILSHNLFTGTLPRSLMKLGNLQRLEFDGQPLCAPSDPEFQSWLKRIPEVSGATCSGFTFNGTIENQSFTRDERITPLILPEAIGGIPPINYFLQPGLPTGLTFNKTSRTISGIPTILLNRTPYQYSSTDSNLSRNKLTFTIEVVSPVSSESNEVPKEFVLHRNYPNPFSEITHVHFDLPWPASVGVEVFDLTGRNILTRAPVDFGAGWGKNLDISGVALSNGMYIYKVSVSSDNGISGYFGNFVRVQ